MVIILCSAVINVPFESVVNTLENVVIKCRQVFEINKSDVYNYG